MQEERTIYAKFVGETTIDLALPRRATWRGREVTGDLSGIPGLPEALGFLPLDEAPEPSEAPAAGHHWEPRYAVADGRIAQSWVQVENPPAPPRTFSKFRLKLAIAGAGFLPQFEQLLASVEVLPGYSGAAAFADAVTLDEDHPKFRDAVAAVRERFGLTAEEVEAILAASVAE